jgi:diaminopimelate decarboxylase
MEQFLYQGQDLYAEGVAVSAIGQQFGTPCFVYSRAALEKQWQAFDHAFADLPHVICYSVKANSNLAVLNVLARLGSGFDVVSGGELERVIAAGGDPKKVVFSGVGKLPSEIRQALRLGILCFNVESEAELDSIQQVASSQNTRAPVALRVNPDVDPQTHPYISTGLKENKFGIDIARATQLYLQTDRYPNIEFIGLDCHIGSQLTELAPFVETLERLLHLLSILKSAGLALRYIDLGGGLGVRYQQEQPPSPASYAAPIKAALGQMGLTLIIEPGRAISANAGILVTEVIYLKAQGDKQFAIVDAAMNDLLRPALYQAWHEIVPVCQSQIAPVLAYDIVGPVCESGDFLGHDRQLSLTAGDLLAIKSAGAYGFTMSSNYNTRPRAAEVMVDGAKCILIREREVVADLFAKEQLLP